MDQWTIARQIKTIGTILIAGLVLVAVIGLVATYAIKGTLLGYRSITEATVLGNAILEDIAEARQAALKWRLSADDASVAEFEGNIEEIVRDSAAFSEEVASDPELSARLETMREALDEYNGVFAEMVLSHDGAVEVSASLLEHGVAAREALSKIIFGAFIGADTSASYYAGQAQAFLLLGRFHMLRYETSELPDEMEVASGHLAKADQQLATLIPTLTNPQWQELAIAASRNLNAYSGLIDELQLQIENTQVQRAALDRLGPLMQGEVETILDALTAKVSSLGAMGVRTAWIAMGLVAFVSVALVAVGLVVTRRISGGIVTRLNTAVMTMESIADGDLDAEVTGAEQQTELGAIARALEVFKTRGKEAIAASERERALESRRAEEDEARKAQEEAREAEARAQADAVRRATMEELSASVGQVVDAAAKGDFSRRIQNRFDEAALTALATSVNTLMQNVETGIGETARVLTELSSGNLTERMTGEHQGKFADLKNSVNSTIETLSVTLAGIGEQIDGVTSSAQSMASEADGLAQRAETQAATIEETSAAMEEIAAAARSNESNANAAAGNARETLQDAVRSGEEMDAAVSTMSDIQKASTQIADIVSVIDGLAFQTNLLALNASVEAARAGDQGKGFAVVAAEVRGLAQRSAEASNDIRKLIQRSSKEVETGAERVRATGDSLSQIVDRVKDIAEHMDKLAETGREQSRSVQEVTQAVDAMDKITQSNAALSAKSSSSARDLEAQADMVRGAVGKFRLSDHTEESAPRLAS